MGSEHADHQTTAATGGTAVSPRPAPGKRTLTQGLPPGRGGGSPPSSAAPAGKAAAGRADHDDPFGHHLDSGGKGHRGGDAGASTVDVAGLAQQLRRAQRAHDASDGAAVIRTALMAARDAIDEGDSDPVGLMSQLMSELGPHRHAGQIVAAPPQLPGERFAALARLTHELRRTRVLGSAVEDILVDARGGRLEAAATEVTKLSARPVDFAHLRMALTMVPWPGSGTLWAHLHDQKNSSEEKVSAVEETVAHRAETAGRWSEPEPRRFKLHIRSFAPFKTFGGGFHGDDRGFSSDVGARTTSRLKKAIEFDLVTGLAEDTPATSDPSKAHRAFARGLSMTTRQDPTGAPPTDTAVPKDSLRRQHSGNVLRLNSELAANLPLVLASPDIDLDSTFTLRATGPSTVLIEGRLSGDGFPDAEVLLEDASGTTVLLHGFATGSGALGGPFVKLWGDGGVPMGRFSVEVTVDAAGHVTGVNLRDTQMSVGDFNGRGEGTRHPDEAMKRDYLHQEGQDELAQFPFVMDAVPGGTLKGE